MRHFILSSWWLLITGPWYSATVVDATTNRPLAGVAVRFQGATGGTTTDAHGTFTLPLETGRPLRLSRLGYAPLTLPLPAQSTSADTLRLLPQAYALSEVAVRPPRALTFSSAPDKRPELGKYLLPGQAEAMVIERPATAPADQPCVVQQVRLFLRDKPRQGRLRVRLVTLDSAATTDGAARPGTQDLLPTPLVLTLEQLAAAPRGKLTLDLSPYNLLLPARGLCLVVECLPTDPADTGATSVRDGKGKRFVVPLPRPGIPERRYPTDDFPALTAKYGIGQQTWYRRNPQRPWSNNYPVFIKGKQLLYCVHVEVQVLAY